MFLSSATRMRIWPLARECDATTTKLVNKKSGQILSTVTLVDSADGKTLTITTSGKDAKGQNIDSVAVYDKQ